MDKPLFDSDVDPKRIKNVADGLRRQGEFESARMLDGYADILEAQEKAVPVATVEDQFGFPIIEWIGDAGDRCPVGTKLHIHPDPADHKTDQKCIAPPCIGTGVCAFEHRKTVYDAERLAEALERTARHRAAADRIDPDQWRSVLYSWEDRALAAHSAQAQPPAARVTDAIARRMVAEYDAVLCGDPTATRTDGMRAALEAVWPKQPNNQAQPDRPEGTGSAGAQS